MASTVAELNAEIEKHKAAFNAARFRLFALLGPSQPKPGAEDVFIAHAYENGVEATLAESRRDAGYFDLAHPVDEGLTAKLKAPLEEIHTLNQRLIDLVAERENQLINLSPRHKPTYFWLGREFTIDPDMQTMTYTDTGEVYAFLREDEKPKSKGQSVDRSR
jgi:hypothetical protein